MLENSPGGLCTFNRLRDKQFVCKGVMGNSIGLDEDGSLVVGAPYAWKGIHGGRSPYDRRTGSIARFSERAGEFRMPVPDPDDMLGAHWGFGDKGQADETDPRRLDLTGTSFVKGI